ncbi:hypothetical protein A3A40_01605 [Candidatus Kaiserbacteria bacterium RIFCSPLOWO2_01_FULL_54_20]|uniref:Pyruvate phosphate dikinase AMP/ATP-binding domain-containing protein n=1 Tax=Candidatus Kaiserbacteria bacterium RIFCSPLOWO2_01_FULL_54_20 TaxID=1798513 RepID=A0A1F6EJU6_9BACT|nr:MAG: hypothetical protein A3A40_01605 [Candidatus Kaiserbacteria bacterium RIFCSPLOWO2_01_FULL_54_20]
MRNSFENVLRGPDERSNAAGGSGTEAQQQSDFEKIISDKVGVLDREKLREDTLRFGAKGANLSLLSGIRDKVDAAVGGYEEYTVPDYHLIPVSVYDKRHIETDFAVAVEDAFTWVRGRKVIIRSSAVYSEDAENLTGAGIYKSIILDADASKDQFIEKIREVYASVDSAEAFKYRADHGIPEEKMGLVVQEFLDCEPDGKGYVNSVVKNIPELMEIAYEDGARPLIVREKAQHLIVDPKSRQSIMHYEIDSYRKNVPVVERLARVAIAIDGYYGQPIQMEFLERDEDHYMRMYLVQARFLPRNFAEKKEFEFPNEKPVFEGRAVGAFDVTLPILSVMEDNSEKDGVVIFDSSYSFRIGGSMRLLRTNPISAALPKSGAVIVLGPPKEGFGHIETICAESGIALIFSKEPAKDLLVEETPSDKIRAQRAVEAHLDKMTGYEKFRLVSNGLDGRVYGVKEEQSDE